MTIDHKLNFKMHVNSTKQTAINRAMHFRSLTYRDYCIGVETASKIYSMICRPLLEYGHQILGQCNKSISKIIGVAERTSLRKITKMRHPNNPLHNPANDYLYEKTKIEPIGDRILRLNKKFIGQQHNINIIEPLIHKLTHPERCKRKLPELPIFQYLRSLI